MTLTKEHYWIIGQPTLIAKGATVTVTEGTQIQFWSPTPKSPYSYGNEPSLLVEGRLNIKGTAEEPVELFPSEQYPERFVQIRGGETGRATLDHVKVMNPMIGKFGYQGRDHFKAAIEHGYFAQWGGTIRGIPGSPPCEPGVYASRIRNTIFDELGEVDDYRWIPAGSADDDAFSPFVAEGCLFDSCFMDDFSSITIARPSINNSTFLGNYYRRVSSDGEQIQPSTVRNWGSRINPDDVCMASSQIGSFGGSSYFVLSLGSHSSYVEDAHEFAVALGGAVASIHSDAENRYLQDYVAPMGGPIAIGVVYHEPEDEIAWLDGSPMDFTAFSSTNASTPASWFERYVVLEQPWTWYSPGGAPKFLIKVPRSITSQEIENAIDRFAAEGRFGRFQDNAFLNEWWNPDIMYWMRFFGGLPDWQQNTTYLQRNYWGTTSETLIDAAIHDWWDQFDHSEVVYRPILERPAETTYPFVVDVRISTDAEDDALQLGAEEILFTVTFNRDMDTSVQPEVTFGPDVPFSDYLVNPVGDGWTDARTWLGRFQIAQSTGDGWQYIRVTDAVAADDPWLKTGNDGRRFRFEIVTGGVASINLQAKPGPGYIDLAWHQDDFELFAGYNLYRATAPEPGGVFTRLNTTVLSPQKNAYRDADVQPNTTYYYKYAVVTTDMSESDCSNTVSAMPFEANPPTIQHQPIASAEAGLSVTFRATVTDETSVESMTLYYRQIGRTDYQSRSMVPTTRNRYSVTLEGIVIQSPGLEYYIEASDGLSTVASGSADSPHRINVTAAGAP